ncbi:MAG TPA: YajQ family cyclic di-GMP-binding protein [Chloroflexota bacterium]|nr:YajQ family cyclic di-GMP-binding protein [Chloroflexota bacterium]
MADNSFDVVSDYDRQEMVNAVDQTHREMTTRYDLKQSTSSLELGSDTITIQAESEHIIQSIVDVLETKMVRRNLSLKILKLGTPEPAAGSTYRLTISLQKGINQDLAREISKTIRSDLPKLKVAIQGDSLRVTGKSKDELQQAMALLRTKDYPVPLQFVNYR